MKGTEKQISFANSLVSKIEKEVKEIKDNASVIKYFALQREIEVNFDHTELETEECQSFIDRRKVKINKQFEEVLNVVESKVNEIKTKGYAGDIITELNKKISADFFNHQLFSMIYTGMCRLETVNKTNKQVLPAIKKTASKEF